ncbi:MFS transporter [Intrasporangium sp.]|uniref:MFS transporter n=1 Tax=Intrasporangium sp. TaxID=1925024 RepID=UPI003221E3CF
MNLSETTRDTGDAQRPVDVHAHGDSPVRPGRSTRYWILVIFVLVVLSEEVAYAFNLVTPALPHIAQAFGTTQIAWVSTAFSLMGAVSAPLFGKLADKHGKKTWLLISAGLMALGSLTVLLAPTYPILLIGRTVEGLGLGIVAITYSLMRDILPPKMMALGVSLATAGIGVTGIIGPYIAGYLLDHHGYRGVFVFLLALPVIVGIAIAFIVPETPVRVHERINYVSALILGAAFGVLLFVLGEGGAWGWTSGKTIVGFLLGLAVLALWAVREGKVAVPLIDLKVVKSRALGLTMITNLVAQAVITVQFVLLAYLVQVPRELGQTYGLGMNAEQMAGITSLAGLASVAMGFLVGWLAERVGARIPNLVGFALMALGSGLLALTHDTYGQVLVGYVVYAFGGGLVSAAIPNLVIAAVPPEQQAVSATTVGVVGSLGSTIAVQVTFAVLSLQILQLIQGSPIYAEQGFTTIYWLSAAASVLAVLATLAMRHGRRPMSVEA